MTLCLVVWEGSINRVGPELLQIPPPGYMLWHSSDWGVKWGGGETSWQREEAAVKWLVGVLGRPGHNYGTREQMLGAGSHLDMTFSLLPVASQRSGRGQ